MISMYRAGAYHGAGSRGTSKHMKHIKALDSNPGISFVTEPQDLRRQNSSKFSQISLKTSRSGIFTVLLMLALVLGRREPVLYGHGFAKLYHGTSGVLQPLGTRESMPCCHF
jgi:hypothetical protein